MNYVFVDKFKKNADYNNKIEIKEVILLTIYTCI